MKEFTSMAMVMSGLKTIKIDKHEQFQELLCRLGNGRKVKVTIQYEDPRQEWINKWYKQAVAAEERGTVFFKFVKDGTVCIPLTAFAKKYTTIAAPRKGDKYDRKTGIAVSYAKYAGKKIPEYI